MRASKPHASDQALICLLETEPAGAMETLIAQYTALVCREAAGYLENPEDVKECVNDVFTEVYFHRADYDRAKGSLATWIGTIARNRAISRYRKQRQELPLQEDSAGDTPSGADRMEELDQAMDLEQAISQLSEADQQLVRMKYYADMSISEIAESLHIPYETAKKRHTRSIKQLRKLLLIVLVIAVLLILAACGVIQLLRYFGFLPGYGVTSDPGASCYLMQERAPTVEAAEYTAWVKSAQMYNGTLAVEFHLEAPEQTFETEYNEIGVATTTPLYFGFQLYSGDGTPLGTAGGQWRSVSDYFHGEGYDELELPQNLMDELQQNGHLALELHITDIVFDGREWPDAVIPFTLAEVREQTLEGYPSIYDEATGGFLLDSRMEDGVLTLDVYPISNGTMVFFGGLTLFPGYTVGISEYEYHEMPVIVGEDGTAYQGESVEESLPWDSDPVTFVFPDAPPGTYTLKLPYVYMLLKQEKALTWNLRSGKVSEQEVSFPGGSFRTVSITESEEPVQTEETLLGEPVVYTHAWEIAVRCEFDSEEITAIQGGYPDPPERLLWAKAAVAASHLLGETSFQLATIFSISPGFPDPESGNLMYQISADNRCVQTCDLKHVRCNPAPEEGLLGPMLLRYDHPMELEFEVLP